jgi:hypothetical protein
LSAYGAGQLPVSYGAFSYDGNEYYLPSEGGQVKAGQPSSTSNPFQFYSNFNTNGATISSIQSCVSGSSINGLLFTWTDGSSNSVGNMNCGGKQIIQFDVENGETISSLQLQGNSGVLCNFIIKTSESQNVQLGDSSCGGNNGASTDMASGILGGVFGYANPSGPVYQLGLLMLQTISEVTQNTASFVSPFPNTPVNTYTGGIVVEAWSSTDGMNDQLVYTQQSGYNSDYSTSTAITNFASVEATLSMSYAGMKMCLCP